MLFRSLPGLQIHDTKESALEAKEPKDIFTGSRIERQIIAMMIQFPEILPDVNNYKLLELFNDDTLKGIGESILEFNPTSADQVS